ncbi:Eco57I restriction-modification methylase domain-containing protein [Leptospira weilii]|nr:TaqI-like C-terminal specificity domain-containing protein [Leptospira weilii]
MSSQILIHNNQTRLKGEFKDFFDYFIGYQKKHQESLSTVDRKRNGIFLTDDLTIIDSLLDILDSYDDIKYYKILEPSCGKGIFLIRLLDRIYKLTNNKEIIYSAINDVIYFNDIDPNMVRMTKNNISDFYFYTFEEEYRGKFNSFNTDFTVSNNGENNLFYCSNENNDSFESMYNFFDFVIGNPPYITLYGRRDKKENELQRIKYLDAYNQFPDSLKNGKLNLMMLFIEKSINLLKNGGKLSFILDISFFETAFKYTRKYLLENTTIVSIDTNIKGFSVASGQMILKLIKQQPDSTHTVQINESKFKNPIFVKQNDWYNEKDEFKFRWNSSEFDFIILDKLTNKSSSDRLGELFFNKNLRTCTMMLDMENLFTENRSNHVDKMNLYPYYQGSKSLREKYGSFKFEKVFSYNKKLQDEINDRLKIELESKGIKNKKRIGLGEQVIYDNFKIYIRQSAKQLIASIDLGKSSANNSLYVFSFRDSTNTTLEKLYYICGILNSKIMTYFAQKTKIIRFSEGKQPQIKISDLSTLPIPKSSQLEKEISLLVQKIYSEEENERNKYINSIDVLLSKYFNLTEDEIKHVENEVIAF